MLEIRQQSSSARFPQDQRRFSSAGDVLTRMRNLGWAGNLVSLRRRAGALARVEIEGQDGAEVKLNPPAGWECRRLGGNEFMLYSEKAVAPRNKIRVVLGEKKVEFTIFGPDEARGFAAGMNVPKCKCGARVEACMCPK